MSRFNWRRIPIGLITLMSTFAMAGIGPENVVVVINGDSAASVAVANEYARLRDIPRCNLVVLHHLSGTESTNVERFRWEILQPVLNAIRDRGLSQQIDCISYSADIPYSIDVNADVKGGPLPRVITTRASSNGLTYLSEWVMAKNQGYLDLDVNRYCRKVIPYEYSIESGSERVQPGVAFRHSHCWSLEGRPSALGPHYMLSTVLGVAKGRGNTVPEILKSLRTAKSADFSAPKGTIYFERNGDVRSKTREWGFQPAVDTLEHLGVKAVVEDGILPISRDDVAGAMIGISDFDWKTSKSKILPGAICEHFTSCGGMLNSGATQTPCTEWIRSGAAGTSGTVTEPYALQEKFPTPFIQVEYAKGFTLAESYYMSVSGPYQLLILGDPLCRPWAKKATPKVEASGLGKPVRGKLRLRTQLIGNVSARRFLVYVDGKRVLDQGSKPPISLNTSAFSAGDHKISVVAIAADEARSEYRATLTIQVARQN